MYMILIVAIVQWRPAGRLLCLGLASLGGGGHHVQC
jgi:hypothetical protein